MRQEQRHRPTNKSSSTKPAKRAAPLRTVSLALSPPPCSTSQPTSTHGPSFAHSARASSAKSPSTPSTGVDTSQPKSTEEIIAAIEDRTRSGAWSPTTSKRASVLSSLITANTSTTEHEAELVASAWAVIDRLTQKERSATSQIEDSEFLLNVGDWISRSAYAGADNIAQRHQRDLEAYFGKYMDQATAQKLVEDHSRWEDLKPRTTSQLLQRLGGEESTIQQWRKDGRNESDAPFTPWVDMVNTIAGTKSINKADYIRLTKVYDKRNKFAHRPPPMPADHIIEDTEGQAAEERIEWSALRARCRDMREAIQNRVRSGKLTQDDGDSLVRMVDRHWRQFSDTSCSEKSLSLKPYAIKEARRACRLHDTQNSTPTLPASCPPPYKKGKWDFIEEPRTK